MTPALRARVAVAVGKGARKAWEEVARRARARRRVCRIMKTAESMKTKRCYLFRCEVIRGVSRGRSVSFQDKALSIKKSGRWDHGSTSGWPQISALVTHALMPFSLGAKPKQQRLNAFRARVLASVVNSSFTLTQVPHLDPTSTCRNSEVKAQSLEYQPLRAYFRETVAYHHHKPCCTDLPMRPPAGLHSMLPGPSPPPHRP